MTYTLWFGPRSPFVRRVRIALERLGVPYQTQEVNVFAPPREFLQANPLGLLPCLQIAGDQVIPDSATILEFLHEREGQKIWPHDLDERTQVRVASTLAEGVMALAVSLFLETQRAHPSNEWRIDFTDSIRRTLDRLSDLQCGGFPFVRGAALSQAGYDLIVALDYLNLRAPFLDWKSAHPKLEHFWQRHRLLPELVKTLPLPA